MSASRNRSVTSARNRFSGRQPLKEHERNALKRRNALRTAVVIDRSALDINHTRTRSRRRVALEQERTQETQLDTYTLSRCYRELAKGMAHLCFNRLRSEMKRFGIMFLDGEEELLPTEAMQHYVSRHLVALQDDALRAIFCAGIVPIAFRRNRENDEIYPYVPPHGSYRITVQTVRGIRAYRFYWTSERMHGVSPFIAVHDRTSVGSQKRYIASGYINEGRYGADAQHHRAIESGFGRYDEGVAIISNLGYEPMLDGTLTSIMAGVLEKYIDFNASLRSDAIAAGYQAARPPVPTEQNPAFDRVANRGDSLAYFVGSDVLQTTGDAANRTAEGVLLSHTYRLSPAQQEARNANMRLLAATHGDAAVEQQYGTSPAHYRKALPTTRQFSPDIGTDEITIGDGRKLAGGLPTPAFRHDTFLGLAQNEERIAWSIGIPTQVFSNQSQVTAGSDLAVTTLNSTVYNFQGTLAALYTRLYDHIFLDRDIFRYLMDRVQLNADGSSVRPPLHTEDDLFSDALNTAGVTVSFRYTPSMDVGDLKWLHGRGMISWETYSYNYLQLTGIDPNLVMNEKDPLPTEAARIVDMPEYKEFARLETQRTMQKEQLAAQRTMQAEQARAAVSLAGAKESATSTSSGGGGKSTSTAASGGGKSTSSTQGKQTDKRKTTAAKRSDRVPQAGGVKKRKMAASSAKKKKSAE